MKASKMNKRISIQNYIEIKNSKGIVKKEWQEYKRVWANIETGIEPEEDIANTNHSKRKCNITIRYDEKIEREISDTEQYRVFYKRPYNLLGIENVNEANVELKLLCEALE